MTTTTTGMNVARISLLVISLVVVAVACGGSSGGELSEAAEAGQQIAVQQGCASCHGADGTGGVGPKFVGLYGSQVTLTDGSTVVADDEYIRRSITDPGAERVEGYAVNMPTNGLDDDEIEAVLTYIRELGTPP